MPVTREYWFARRFPVGNPRASYAPVHWKGWAVAAIYIAVLTIGGMGFAWMGATGYLVQGVVVFVVAAILGTGWFIIVARATGDSNRTVEDYRKAQPRA